MAWFSSNKNNSRPERYFDDDDAGENPNAVHRCHYCGDELGADSIFQHESTCVRNPNV